MSSWLADFAYRVTIHWSVFAMAGIGGDRSGDSNGKCAEY